MKKSSVTMKVPERITASGSHRRSEGRRRRKDSVVYRAGNVRVSMSLIVVALVVRVVIDPIGEGNIRSMRATVDYVAGNAAPADRRRVFQPSRPRRSVAEMNKHG
jgi:hypothetical protein